MAMHEARNVIAGYEDDDNQQLELNCLLQSPIVDPELVLVEPRSRPCALWGFYSYSFASEVFAIVSVSLFLPITLEQLARDNGYTLPNHSSFCHGSRHSTSQTSLIDPKGVCQVKLLGRWVDTASFPLYVFSVGVALQAIIVASLGDAADNPIIRKSLLICFAAIGSLSGMIFFLLDSTSSTWSLSAILTIVSNIALCVSGVCLNSYLPSLAKMSPEVLEAEQRLADQPSSMMYENENYKTLISKSTADISSKGIAIGYSSGIVALGLSLIIIIPHEGNTDSLIWAIGFSAIWWAVFTIPAAFWLPPSGRLDSCAMINSFDPLKSYRHILGMLAECNRMRNAITFLFAWFLLSDAFSTITSTAIIFGKTTLEMSSSHLVLIGFITPTTGILGALIAPIIQKNLQYCSGLNGSLKMLKLLIGLSCLVPGYVAIPLAFGIAVLTTEMEMYILAAVFGLFYGAFQSYARSVYSELIPSGQEAKWYALYSITDKSSSFFGPFVVGVIADSTHNIRFGFVFILLILLSSFPLLNRVNIL